MNIGVCGLVVACGVLVGAAAPPQTIAIESDVGTTCFAVEIADTHWSRARGLMHRDGLGPSEGMLFVYDEARSVAFWMKNVRFPLDILFVDDVGRIVRIVEAAEPGSVVAIKSGSAVNAVLEIRGGASRRAQIRPGDIVSLAVSEAELAHCPDKK